jgi:hypothetical protein
MTEANNREYEELKRFLEVWRSHVYRGVLPEDVLAGNVIAAYEKRTGRPVPMTGMRQALGDALEDAQDFGPDQIAHLDEVLRKAGAPTLTQLLLRQARTFKAILRRGKIRSDTEFYLVSAALGDTANGFDDAQIAALNGLVAAYEARS